jgi:hypothetical protein
MHSHSEAEGRTAAGAGNATDGAPMRTLPPLRPHIPAWRAASAGPEPARHAVCTPPSSPRSRIRLTTRALQTLCSCNLGRQLGLGDAPCGAACICATGILNAGSWALRTARCSLACVLAACPSAHEHALYAHANVAQATASRAWSASVRYFCVVVCCHTLSCTGPQSCFGT